VMDILFHALVRYAAPILCFTAEEAWQTRYPDDATSVHLLEWPQVDAAWADDALAGKWQGIRQRRALVTEAIEPLRREKIVRSSLEAEVATRDLGGLSAADFAEICIVAKVTPGEDAAIAVHKTDQHKCGRCWRLLPEVVEDGDLCDRCDTVVNPESTP